MIAFIGNLFFQHDRSIINLHLMNTSYFLFVMVVTLFCYALLKGKPQLGKAKASQTSETVSIYLLTFHTFQ